MKGLGQGPPGAIGCVVVLRDPTKRAKNKTILNIPNKQLRDTLPRGYHRIGRGLRPVVLADRLIEPDQ